MSDELHGGRSVSPTSVRDAHRTLRELVFDNLLHDIIRARFKPGEQLKDTELAELYGVSRGPIREAIRFLEAQGLVKVTPFKGAVVTRLTRAEVQEIYRIRIELEGLAARLAVPRLTPEDIAEIEQQFGHMSEMRDSPAGWHSHTEEFHLALYRRAEQPRLYQMIRELMRLTMPYAQLYLNAPGSIVDTHPEHEVLLAAIKAGDVLSSETITEEHLQRSSRIIVELIAADE